ncbi:hypothetical protein N8371_09285 [Vicingaceae bacterium]|nr:hypothetical protein [Vicingaceae bacterium]MDC1452578.1 hypothetical protein [Vicingaceae bacterium]
MLKCTFYKQKDFKIDGYKSITTCRALKGANVMIESFKEYDYAPYNFISKMVDFEPGKF